MSKRIVVIGAGPGGYVAAIRAAQLGAEVTLIEKENVGGTCLNWGCVPSKILKASADMMRGFGRADEFGLVVPGAVRVDMKKLMARKRSVIDSLADEIIKLLARRKVRYLHGLGRITGDARVTIDLGDGGNEEVIWEGLVLAPGTKPDSLPNLPIDGQRIISSNEAMELEEVPESCLIVGGGVIGCEFAFILSSLGSRVTVVEALSRLLPLPSIDEDCSKIIAREMKKHGIRFMVNRVVEKVDEAGANMRVTIGPSPFLQNLKQKDRTSLEFDISKVLVCIGRRPNSDGLGLKEMGVKMDQREWVLADERMATSVPNVYAIGDVLGPNRTMLAHVASVEGIAAAENLMGGGVTVDYSAVPSAIFTVPEVGCVGLTEAAAKERGLSYRSDSVNIRNVSKAQVMGEIAGQAKIISDVNTGRILGVHIVGPHATDLIGEATLAIRTGCTIRDLAETVHAHPTLAEILLETSYKALDRPIHG
jgi:dihydrolipoamide dehydrogenase